MEGLSIVQLGSSDVTTCQCNYLVCVGLCCHHHALLSRGLEFLNLLLTHNCVLLIHYDVL